MSECYGGKRLEMIVEESKAKEGWGRHMVQERGVVSLSSSPAVSQSTRIPWHRWDRTCVCVWECMCVSLDIFVMADDDETHSGWHRWGHCQAHSRTNTHSFSLLLANTYTQTHFHTIDILRATTHAHKHTHRVNRVSSAGFAQCWVPETDTWTLFITHKQWPHMDRPIVLH